MQAVAGAAALADLATPSSLATWAWGPGEAVEAPPSREAPLEFVSVPPRQVLALRSPPSEAQRALAAALPVTLVGPPPVHGLLAPGCPGPLALEAKKDWRATVAPLLRGQGPALVAVEVHP